MPRGIRIGHVRALRLAADSFTLQVSGIAAAVSKTLRLTADAGAYALTGRAAGLSTSGSTEPPIPVSSVYRPYLFHPKGNGSAGFDPEGDGSTGMTSTTFNRHLGTKWEFENGDYIGADGVKYNGSNAAQMVPWHILTIPQNTPVGYTDFDFTALVAHWFETGHNRGAYILCTTANFSAWADITGNKGANPLKLTVTTSAGVFEVFGDIGGWNSGSTTGLDTRMRRRINRSGYTLIQFETLLDTPGTFISARLNLWVEACDNVYPLIMRIFETDAPPLYLGSGGKAVELGIADAVGEYELINHPAVDTAGDCRQRNLFHPALDGNATYAATATNPTVCSNYFTINQTQRQLTEFRYDRVHAPGTWEYRGILYASEGNPVGRGDIFYRHSRSGADLSDPLRPQRADSPKRLFARIYVFFESDFVSATTDQFGFKMGLGFDMQTGIWNGLSWNESGGSGQSPSYGVRRMWYSRPSTGRDPLLDGAVEGDLWHQYDVKTGTTFNRRLQLQSGVWVPTGEYLYVYAGATNGVDQWIYEGHSLRGHSGSFMGTTNTKYPNLIALNNAPSHLGDMTGKQPGQLGVYDIKWDGGIYGTEQTLRIGTGPHSKHAHMFELEKWYCVEAEMQLNTVDMSSPDARGNGHPNNDGILRYYIDGAMVGERTNLAWTCRPDAGICGSRFIMYHGGDGNGPNADMHYRLNHFCLSEEYIGPNPVRNYVSGVNPPSDPPASGTGSLTSFLSSINFAAAPLNSWIDTGINAKGAWAVKSMVDGGRYATQAEVEPGPADVGNFNAIAADTLVNSNGAAWFPEKKRFYWSGGGHGGWMGNEVYWMDMETLQMGRATNPSPIERWPEGPTGWGWKTKDGTLQSRHTYNGIVAVEELNAFFVIGGSPWPDGNFPDSDIWRFDLATYTWTKVLSNALSPVTYAVGSHAIYVPSQRKIAIGRPNYWRWYDPFTNTVGPILASQSTLSNGNSVGTNAGIYAFGSGGSCFYLPYANLGLSAPTSMNSSVIPRMRAHPRWLDAAHQWNSFLWDSNRNMVISWSASYTSEPTTGGLNKGKQIYGLDFANDHLWEFSSATPGAFARSQSLGSFTKFQHIPGPDLYIGCNNRMIGDAGNSQGWLVFKPGTPTRLT
jgi:hypothetical protein